MADTIYIEDDERVELTDEQLERAREAERSRHAEIVAAWDRLDDHQRRIFIFIHEKIMEGKFDGLPHNHITYLNQTRNIWVRQFGLRLGKESDDA